MMSFPSDWWEAFVISRCYEMGDPLAPSEVEGNREGGGLSALGGLVRLRRASPVRNALK
jgi:hypothetical protein